MPTAAGCEKGEGQGDDQGRIEQGRRIGADQRLDYEGRIGADHHHLAMGHVDDPHHAEGDGEPDGREQQHRAERQPVPDVLQRLPHRQLGADGTHGGGGGLPDVGPRGVVGGDGRERCDQPERVLVAARFQRGDGVDLLVGRRVRHGREKRGPGLGQSRLDPGIGLLADRGLDQGQGACGMRGEDFLRRREALDRIGRDKVQRTAGGIEFAAHAVVEAHLLQRTGGNVGGRCGACLGVVQCAGIIREVDGMAAGIDIELLHLQCTKDGGGRRRPARGQSVDALFRFRKLVEREMGQRVVHGIRPGGHRAGEHGHHQDQGGGKKLGHDHVGLSIKVAAPDGTQRV